MKSTEKLDLILKTLYYRINDGFLPIHEILPSVAGMGEAEIKMYAEKLREDKHIETKIEPGDIWHFTQAKLTFTGITFCETDSYTIKNTPIIK